MGSTTNQFFGHLWRISFKNFLGILLLGLFFIPNVSNAQIDYCTSCSGNGAECDNPTTNPNNNPDLTASCGELDIVFVLDESNSINTTAEINAVRQGTLSFLNSLSCTGTRVAMVEFGTTARILNNYRDVDDDYVNDVTDYFDGTNNAGVGNLNYRDASATGNAGATNWQAAMLAVDEFAVPDVILFFTDGVPTAWSTGQNPTKDSATSFCGSSNGSSTQPPEIANPVKLSNKLKGEGAHMFMLGVGMGANASTLQQMAGNNELTPTNGGTLGTSDYILEDFAGLAECLVTLVSNVCPFDSDVTSADVCTGDTTGSAEISVPNNFLPFGYAYFNDVTNVELGSGTSSVSPLMISGLGVGSYRVEVLVEVPGENCTRTESFFFDIQESPSPILTAVPSDSSCFGEDDGAIDITASGGTPPFVYAWTTTNGSGLVPTDEDQTGLAPGEYEVMVTDDNGCTASDTITIEEPDEIEDAVIEIANATCDAAGTATITNYDAALTYTFVPNDGTTVGAGGVISGFVPGTDYTVTASSSANCSTDPTNFNVSPATDAPDQPVVQVTDATCDAAGTATITNYDDTLTYTFAPNDGTTVGAGGVISGFVPGTDYTVTASSEAQNGDDCSSEARDFNVAPATDAPDQPTVNVTDATCDAAGTATITNYDATLTYTFAPNDGTTVGAGGVISGFVPGTDYTVTASSEAQNGDDCSSQPADFNVAPATDAPDQPVVEVTDATCDTAGTATITNYDATLTYTFAPNDGTTVGAGGVISGFVPGTDYTVTASSEAQNGDDCSSQPVGFNVSPATDAPDQPTVNVTDATCDAAGTATITNYDATLTYTFAPNDGTTVGTGGVISGFVPGTDYTVTASSEAQNGDDCSSQPVGFNVAPATDAPDQPVVEVTDATCDTAGTATITNYDAALTYTFAPNDGTTVGAGGVISGFVPGTDYTVTASSEAQNGDDCSSQPADFGIIEPTPPNAGDDNEITVCDGASVDLTSLVTESDGTFSEAMISGGLDGDSFDTTGLSPGSYEIIYTVEAGQLCPADTATITIHVAEPVDAGADNTISVCEGTVVDLSELVTVPGGTFSATNGGSVNGNEFDTSGLSPGDYSIEYTVDGGDFCPDDTALITVSVAEDIIVQTCEAVDATSCNDGTTRFNFYWFGSNASPGGSNAFGSNATNNLSFTEFNDGTALIQGTTVLGSCTAALYIKLVGKTDWAGWQLEGGTFKKMGCTNPDPTMLHYYVIDNTVSTITTTGGDCLEEGTFIVSQKPDPNDPLTPHLGVVMGPGGVLHGVDPTATGIAGWGFMGPENDPKKYDIDFNFELDCEDATGCEIKVEICDGIDNDGDGQIDEGFDSDGDGIADCEDVEECDGIDNDGDLLVDEGFDSDMDGTADCFDEEICDGLDNDGDGEIDEGLSCGDIEVCDGVDNDGDGEIDEGFDDTDNDGIADCVDPCDNRFDSDGDNIPDCEDVEECDGLDNDGDGMVDEGFADTDNDGTADCQDVEECDGLDNDGDGEIDEGFDSDGDGTPDCQDVEECDGLDNDGDGTIDEGFADTDGDGIADCIDVEECDGKDNDGDGEIDEGFDSDGDGTPDCRDIEECDGVDNDGDGEIDEDLDCTEVCDGIDNDGDGEIDEGFDSDGDGTPDCEDTEECDGVDNDGDGEIDEGFDSDGDGTADCEDTEECDGVDNDGDGEIDEGFDSDGDGTPDCEDTEECDGVDNDGDGEIDEGFDSDGDGTADCEDTEECDGVDNNGDGEIDEGFDSDGDGTPDCEDTEECDGVDNDGDGEIDEDLNCDDAPEGCETAFARLETNNTCFLDDGFNRWGWTNQLTMEGNYTMDLYSGAGQCDLTKGEKSGTVEVEHSNGSVTVSIELSPGFVMTEAQLYVGGAPYPVKGNNPTVAPGQYPVKEEGLDKVTRLDFDPIDVSHITGDLYIIVHAVTCEVETDDSTAKTEVQAFPMTFKNELNLRVEIPYDSNLKVEMFDVNGRCVLEKGGMSLKTGKNDIRLNLSNMAPDVYILILNTERERIIKKVMSRK